MGDHTEAVRIEFDPAQISYGELLDQFWGSHDPTFQPWNRQYRNAVFTTSPEQAELAGLSRRRQAQQLGREVVTAIEPAGPFYPAEDHHQKYLLRRADSLFRELGSSYPDESSLLQSTAATRLNGYLGCNGEKDRLQEEIDDLGLSPGSQEQLVDYLLLTCNRFVGLTCPTPR